MSPPFVATYRLQLRNGVGFREAAAIVPYIARLGASHLYASPILRAREGSTHGYDGTDPRRLDEALGGDDGFRELVAALSGHGMGLLLDIVPNHLALSAENPWWRDLLRHGRDGEGARFFDVDWQSLGGKLLVPVLGRPYGEVLTAGELSVVEGPEPEIAYYEHRFPVAPETWPGAPPATPEALHALLEAQHYRLAWWRCGDAMLNWRRYFDITELVGLRVEDPAVFEATHAKILELVRDGAVHGLRIDHLDGLADPGDYLRRLDSAWRAVSTSRPWVVVEKVLGPGDEFPEGWPVAGTTGYEALAALTGLFVDPSGKPALDATWRRFGGDPDGYPAEVAAAKRLILERGLAAETARLVARLAALATQDLSTRDLPPASLREALIALLSTSPVARSHGAGEPPQGVERQRLEAAFAAARPGLRPPALEALDFLRHTLLDSPATECRPIRTAFEQLAGPVVARAVEDTALYRWHRLTALNEVGCEPDHFGTTPEGLHAFLQSRAGRWPEALIATATHDTKRGEDTRLRICALTELSKDWAEEVSAWAALNAPLHAPDAPEPAVEYLFYQTLVGVLPLEPSSDLADRLWAYMRKALREAKRRTSWLDPDESYEAAVEAFVRATLDPARSLELLDRLRAFGGRIAPLAAVHGLAQTLLKLTAPGVPDIYQGAEGWDLSLVDPDNRRPIDFPALARALDEPAGDLLRDWQDGRVKQRLIATVLAERRKNPRLWTHGAYLPLGVEGPAADRLLAFAREHEGRAAIVLAPRLVRPLLRGDGSLRLRPEALAGTTVNLPPPRDAKPWRNILDGQPVTATGPFLADWPVALLT
jgi:malto-oligosyltrehalose synthase